jgi:hypothetical protein
MMTDEEISELYRVLGPSAGKPFLLHSFRGISGAPPEQARIIQLDRLLLKACFLWSETAFRDNCDEGIFFQNADGISDKETLINKLHEFSEKCGMQYRGEAMRKGVPVDDILADMADIMDV